MAGSFKIGNYEVKEYTTSNGGVCVVEFPFVENIFNEKHFTLPEFEGLTYDYTNYDSPHGLLSQKAEHGKWFGYPVESNDDAIANEIGIYYTWLSESATCNGPCYECGISYASIFDETGWGAIPDITDIIYAQVPVFNDMSEEDNAKMAYDALCEVIESLGLM